jgi:transcription factor C subunit 6
MILCVDNGPAFDLKWCPLPSHGSSRADEEPKKLGLLAGTFEDGSFCVYAVPDPDGLVNREDGPCLIKIDPLLRIELPEAACWSFDWANSQRVAIGTTNGWSWLQPHSVVLTRFRCHRCI